MSFLSEMTEKDFKIARHGLDAIVDHDMASEMFVTSCVKDGCETVVLLLQRDGEEVAFHDGERAAKVREHD